jgi:uncharacterized membrane protein YGL010W
MEVPVEEPQTLVVQVWYLQIPTQVGVLLVTPVVLVEYLESQVAQVRSITPLRVQAAEQQEPARAQRLNLSPTLIEQQ